MRSVTIILLAVLSLAFFTAADTSACRIDTPKGPIDLNLLRQDTNYNVVGGPDKWNYYVNICGAATGFDAYSVCKKSAEHAKGYQVSADKTQCFPMTDDADDSLKVELLDKDDPTKGAKLTYNSFKVADYERSVEITAKCDPSQTTPKFEYVDEIYNPSPQSSHYKFSITSSNACPNVGPGPKPSENLPLGQLGVGGLIIILSLLVLVSYFIIGTIVLKFKFKREGTDIIPNYGFWKSLPGLIVDGPLLFVDLIKRRSQYGEIV